MVGRRLLPSLALALLITLPARAQDLPDLKRGDVIFQNSQSAQSLAILLATDSPFTHVGILDFDAAGNPVVLEAVRTTRATPLQDWVAQGKDGAVAVYRMEELGSDTALAVTEAARSHLGKGYDPYFFQSEDTIYCSELVHIAFRDGAGVALGQVQALGDLNLDSAAVRALIAERWQSHPACSDGQAQDAESCLALIRDEPLVTPQAVAEDGRLRLVFSSFDG
ncbi:YiiX/YebB-like N1pC/P60 family cysteine hydrolase [Tabrizicola sp.]|uniref:YiiX/YebB-like N1pC/P60 family cysteine hydrolase n=1 Tax=Tabrizicola sp. TaxID=2005166 RepID=UPI0025F47E34|nr:YiiX/YebB-like N1pC/P60 family cysteine hydrolase [Tabrizicola sp.]